MEKQKAREDIALKYKWDLSKMYNSSIEINNDIQTIKKDIKNLVNKYKNHILDNSNTLYEAIILELKINRVLNNLNCYANMKFHEDTNIDDSQSLVGDINNLSVTVSEKLSFFEPEILNCSYDLIKKYLNENKKLEEYKFYLEEMFSLKNHILSEDKEMILALSEDVLSSASDIFDRINDTDIKFGFIKDEQNQKVELTKSNYSKYISSSSRSVRKQAFKTLYKSYEDLKNTLATCLYKDVKASSFIAKVRNYDNPLQMSLITHNIDPKLYDKLINTVSKRLDIVYKYINIRKKIMGIEKIHMYDLYNPLFKDSDKEYNFEEAKNIILDTLKVFGDDYILKLKKAFDERWIDVYNNKGKRGGAYSWGSYDSYPYLLLNYENKFDDVSTLIHELGHSMHSYYSNENQNYQYASYPIFLAEIASTVNEMLLNRYMYNKATTKEEKLSILTDLLDSFRTTLIRQTMFAEFEKIIYEKNLNNEVLTTNILSNTYYELNKKYYGEEIVHDKEIKYEWSRIPHFYSSFYVYQYATGICVAAKITKEILNGNKEMLDNYILFLKSGGSDYPLNILKKCGIDIVNDNTIDDALDMFNDTLNELIELYNK